MPTYQLTLEYDGTDFSGWQAQPRARTVAGVLAAALRTVTGEIPPMTAAGRTDAGAHAHGQVAGVSLSRAWDPVRLRAALNATLPGDVAVVDAALRADGFDARRDAVDRTYRYIIIARSERAPVTRRHTWTVAGPLDAGAMRRGAQHLVGRHDFAAFGGPTRPDGPTVRTVREVTVERRLHGETGAGPVFDVVIITVRADAFLRGMMRAFAGALVKVGQSRVPDTWVAQLLDAPSARSPRVPVAPARGLHQWSVDYGSYTLAAAA